MKIYYFKVKEIVRNPLGTSIIGVAGERCTRLVMGHAGDIKHVLSDLCIHIVLNTIRLPGMKKAPEYIKRSADALLHICGKYIGHELLERISHTGHLLQHEHHHEEVAFLSLPIVVCVVLEQIYKILTITNEKKFIE